MPISCELNIYSLGPDLLYHFIGNETSLMMLWNTHPLWRKSHYLSLEGEGYVHFYCPYLGCKDREMQFQLGGLCLMWFWDGTNSHEISLRPFNHSLARARPASSWYMKYSFSVSQLPQERITSDYLSLLHISSYRVKVGTKRKWINEGGNGFWSQGTLNNTVLSVLYLWSKVVAWCELDNNFCKYSPGKKTQTGIFTSWRKWEKLNAGWRSLVSKSRQSHFLYFIQFQWNTDTLMRTQS